MYRRSNLVFRIIDSFFRHYILFLLATVTVAGVVTALLLTREKTYAATAYTQVYLETDLNKTLGFYRETWVTPAQQNAARLNDLLRDNRPTGFVAKALKNAALENPINVDPASGDKRFELLMKKLSIFTVSNDAFAIALTWPDPKECERIVKAIQLQYITDSTALRTASAGETTSFLEEEIGKTKIRLKQAEQALTDYKEQNAGQTPEAQASEMQRLSDLKQERDILKITAQDNAARRSVIARRMREVKPTAILEQTVTQSRTAIAINSLVEKRADTLAKGFRLDSDDVRDIDAQIASLKQVQDREYREAVAKNRLPGEVEATKYQDNPEYLQLSQQHTDATIAEQTHAARMRLLEQQIGEYEARVRRMPAAERLLTEKTRDYNVVKEHYEDLLRRREQANLKKSLDEVAAASTLTPGNEVYADATLGDKKRIALIGGALILGLLVGTMLVVANEWADPTIRYEADAERMLGLPVLAALPENKEILSLPAPAAAAPGWRRLVPGQREN